MERLRQGGFLISKIHQLSGRIFGNKLRSRRIELNPAQGRILFALWERDGIAIQELAKRTGLSKSTLSRMLDRLEASGHLIRTSPDDDRRKVIVELTDDHRTMRAGYAEVSEEMAELYYRDFSASEIDDFEQYLHRILENLSSAE